MRVRLVSVLAAAVFALALTPVLEIGTVAAYSPSSAASWADAHDWAIRGCDPSRTCDGCADFVSQALAYGGGYTMVGVGGDMRNLNYWWQTYTPYVGWSSSWSWRVAPYQWDFQIYHYPGGYDRGEVPGTSSYSYDGLSTGDLIFYDWDNDGGIDHVTIQVGTGYDYYHPNFYGNYIDAYNRYHAFWSLLSVNTLAASTNIWLMHIDPAN